MDQDKIGKFIKQLRIEKELSQYQLADMVPISRQAVSKWERGESIPDSSTLIRLSDIFNVTINELLAGKHLKDNSIKQLENTTLSILDDSNNKSKRIKRNFRISVIIITTLLLSFLSYYFINSYNSTKVYTITGNGENFKIRDGIYLTTKGKNYIRLGNVKYNEDLNITNIKMYYKDKNKEIIIMENKDIEQFVIMNRKSYYNQSVRDNTYIEIKYNDKQKETIKLKFKRDYSNNSLFFDNKTEYNSKIKKVTKFKSANIGTIVGVIVKENETKEEHPAPSKDMIEGINVDKIVEHDKTLIEVPKEEIVEEIFDIDKIIENLKEKSFEFDGTYIYEEESIMFLYYENLKQLSLYKNDEFMWDYYISEDRYNCSPAYENDCKNEVLENLKTYLK